MTDQTDDQAKRPVERFFTFPFMRDALVAMVAACATLFGQAMLMGPQQTTADASLIQSITGRLNQVELNYAELQKRYQQSEAEKTSLRIELAAMRVSINANLDFEDLLCGVLESKPGLNWAKTVEIDAEGVPHFRMLCLDSEYKSRFNIGPFEYIGQTDFDFWPELIAQGFYQNDLDVYSSRKALITREYWVDTDGRPVSGLLTKFYFRFGEVDSESLELIIGDLPRDLEQGRSDD